MLFGIEEKVFSALKELKSEYHLSGIKCELEAEGSSLEDIVRLREMCSRLGVGIHVKLGGAEAKTDLIACVVLGADGVVAPMIESEFAAHKFRKLAESIYGEKSRMPHMAINIESKAAVERMGAILSKCDGFLDQVTFGRTDLSGSYFSKDVTPDSGFILGLVATKAAEAKKQGLATAMGGSISVRTVSALREMKHVASAIDQIETRKCILPTIDMLREGALAKCIEFEKLYLVSMKEKNEIFNRANVERLVKLEQRSV